jgi:hypothetical protein
LPKWEEIKVEIQNLQPNRILAAMSFADLDLLRPDLVEVDLPIRYRLAEANQEISAAFFLNAGMAPRLRDIGRRQGGDRASNMRDQLG